MENRIPQDNSDKGNFPTGWPPTYQSNYPYSNKHSNPSNQYLFDPFNSIENSSPSSFNYNQSKPYSSSNLQDLMSQNQNETYSTSQYNKDNLSESEESEYIVTVERLTDLNISPQYHSSDSKYSSELLSSKPDNSFNSQDTNVPKPINIQDISFNVDTKPKLPPKNETVSSQEKTEELISFDEPNKSSSQKYNSLYHFRVPWRNPYLVVESNNKPIEILSTPYEFIVNLIGRNHNNSLVIKKVNNHIGSINEVPTESLSKQYNKRYTSYGLLGIITLELPNKKYETYLVFIIGIEHVGNITNIPIYKITQVHFVSFNHSEELSFNSTKKYPYDEFKSFCENGSFYFSLDYDLTHSQQRLHEFRDEMSKKGACHAADPKFFWNRFLAKPFINRNLDNYVAIVIRGHISILNKKHPEHDKSYDYILLSRISCSRAGTRYNVRGINDNGDVANFVETEQIISNDKYLTSFLQIRGSVPIYWEEPLTKTGYTPTLSRSSSANLHVFKKHFDTLYERYGKVHIVNLIGYKKKEGIICYAYEDQLANLKVLTNPRLSYTHFDFHSECSNQNFDNLKKLNATLKEDMAFFGFFKYDLLNFKILQKQKGIFRTNCIDCLDRTNVTQTSIGQDALLSQVRSIFDTSSIQTYSLMSASNTFWADNGDNLSLSYAGTGALNSSYTRKGKSSIAGLFNNSFKSISRFYINTFKDTDTQKYVDLFLGKIDFRPDNEEDIWVKSELNKKEHEFTDYFTKNVFISTFNCLGRPPPSIHPVEKIVQPHLKYEDIDLWVFGFQEIVELNPSQIFSADTTNGKLWDEYLLKYLNSKRSEVVHLKSEQLVGIYLSIFVSKKELPHIKNVNFCLSKVGLKGMSGDKGAITISLDYYDTSICFVSSHLSSGQKNFNDRINDYKVISNNIRIGTHPKTSKKLYDHDYAFWFGDLNWRIELPHEKTMYYIHNGDFDSLQKHDQLKIAKDKKLAFYEFNEGPITFFPTYKFTVGTNKYEPIETNRPPGWTDRILFRSTNNQPIECINYSSVDLYISDHLPVKGEYSIVVKAIDHEKRLKMEEDLYKKNHTLKSLLLL